MDPAFNRKRWLLLALGVVVFLIAGVIYAWTNLNTPLIAFGWRDDALTFNYTLTVIFYALGGLLAGALAKKFSERTRLLAAAALFLIGFVGASCLTAESSILTLYFFYGFLLGSAIGIAFNIIVATMIKWFPDKKGLCSGILLTGYGLGSFFIGLICGHLISDGVMGWRAVYRLLGVIGFVIIAVGAVFIKAPPADAPLPEAKSGKARSVYTDYTTREMMGTRSFWTLALCLLLMASIGLSVIGCSRSLLLSLGVGQDTAIFFASFISVMNSLGRLFTGTLADRLGFDKTRSFGASLCVVAPAVTLAGILLGSAVVSIVGAMLCGFTYGFHATLTSPTALDYFGPKNHSLNFSVLNANAVFIALFPTIFSKINLAFGGSYIPGLVFLIIVAAVALTFSLMTRRPSRAKVGAGNR